MESGFDKKIGAGVVGLGVGQAHAECYAAHDACDLCWVYDIDIRKADATAAKLACRAAERYERITGDPDVDIVSIASFDDAHSQQVIAGLKCGKHLFVEKPLCNTLEELQAIKAEWAKHRGQVKLSSNLVLRAAPLYVWLKEKVESDDFGEIYAFDGEYLYGRLHKITQGWRGQAENYSGMKGGGIHMIDLMVWLTGMRPRTVSTAGNRICTRHSGFPHYDYTASRFTFESGLVGRITANLGCVHRHHHVVRIFGTKATFIYDDAGARLHRSRNPESAVERIAVDALPKGKADLIPGFVKSIISDENLDRHTQGIFDVVSICAACDQSMEENRELDIDYI